ncbi:unnamed protein product [Triticum turgidum subsp. durum]|uniref:PGG domain-containing protein n=1 Tax=Triticum turgidum subsp. durum TaxID=4567 RepID=A0A9R0TVR9_TRITD|nr:unnamed protein product [Triticum turgidum subsp. durum]
MWEPEEYEFVWRSRDFLLMLATLVVNATYVAGLNPPGGLFVEDGDGHRVGGPVLATTYPRRYAAFFYCNAAAFLASLVIIMILLDRRIVGNRAGLTVLQSAMVLGLLALTGAFAAASCHGVTASIYVPAAFAVLLAYVTIHLLVAARAKEHSGAEDEGHLRGRRSLPLLLATFATPLAYGAGLAPPGGFWFDDSEGSRVGDPVLADTYPGRYLAFFYCNATCFVSSLVIVTLLLSRRWLSRRVVRSYALQICVLLELLGLVGAYAAAAAATDQPTVYIVSFAGAVLLYIVLVGIFCVDTTKKWLPCLFQSPRNLEPASPDGEVEAQIDGSNRDEYNLNRSRSVLLLLATLTATVTYQAGLNPPGGYWRDEDYKDYRSGHPALLDVLPKRYKAFFHCNTTSFVASLVVIVVVRSKQLILGAVVKRHVLQVAIILSQLGLMGAYASGSSRDVSTTICISALAVANVVVFIILGSGGSKRTLWVERTAHKVLKKLHLLGDDDDDDYGQCQLNREDQERSLEKKRRSLIVLAMLAATVTYQTGLNSAGGFWEMDYDFSSKKLFSETVLLGYDRSRYLVFFYCNAVMFMAAVAVILFLVNQRLHEQSIRSNALQACIMIGFLALRTAYALGTTHKVSTSVYVFGLVAGVITYLVLQILPLLLKDSGGPPNVPQLPFWIRCLFQPLSLRTGYQRAMVSDQEMDKHTKRRCLMLLGVLTASMTYQAGLVPPGGTWVDSRSGHRAGDPIMRNVHLPRYQAFFYCNATSFAASVILIVLLMHRTVSRRGAPLRMMQAAMVLDLAGLLGACAAGTCWVWEQVFAYVTTLVAAVVVYVALHVLLWRGNTADPAPAPPSTTPASSHQPLGNIY